MKKKGNKLVVLFCTSILVISLIFFTACDNKKNIGDNNDNGDNQQNENTDYDKIKLFNKTLNSLNELDETDVQEYLKMAKIVFKEKTYTSFNNDDISILVAYLLKETGPTSSTDSVQKLVKKMFNIDNFELTTGELNSPLGTKITISKTDDDYKFDVQLIDVMEKGNYYKSMDIDGNQVIVHYDYNKLISFDPIEGHNYELIGTTDIYLKYKNGNLVLEKIIYTKK